MIFIQTKRAGKTQMNNQAVKFLNGGRDYYAF